MNRSVQELLELVAAMSDPRSVCGMGALSDLAADGGLSAEMTSWGLQTTLLRYTPDALHALCRNDLQGAEVDVLLARSVPTAPLRAIALPLLRGAKRVRVRPSSRQGRFANAVIRRLSAVERIEERSPHAEVVIAYGRDETLDHIASELPADVRFEGHGHGFGALLMDDGEVTEALVNQVAWDVCAYDQRGCLSPQVMFTLGDGAVMANALAEALERIAVRFPKAAVDLASRARVMQWQGMLAALGARLIRTSNGAVAFVEKATMIGSPGERNIAVVQARSMEDIQRMLAPHALQLSSVGVSDPRMQAALPQEARPRVVAFGMMQDPALDGPEDPRPPRGR